MSDRVEDVRRRLEGIADELAELALDLLRQAVDEEDPGRAAAGERRITRARRAVEKAAGLLDDRGGADE